MTRAYRTTVLLVLAAILGVSAQLPAAQVPRATLLAVRGLVKTRPASGTWHQATLPQNRYLWPRDELQTHQHARARVGLDGATLELGPLTHIVIPGARAQKPTVRTLLQVLKGKLLILLIGARPVEIGTAGATASARGTKFLVEVDDAGLTVLTVIEGSVDFHNDLGQVLVSAGEQSTAGPGRAPSRPMRVDPSTFLDWEASLDSIWLGFEKLQRPGVSPEQRQALLGQANERATANPNDAAALAACGDLLHDSGDYTAAEEAYGRTLQVAPTDDLRLKLAYALLAQGRNREAAAAFAQAAQAPALKGVATAGQAIAALGTGGDAAGLATQALSLSPQSAEVAVMAGFAALRSGRLDQATAALERALQLDPKEYRAPALLALAKLAAGDGKAATDLAAAAVAAAPCSGLAHEALAAAAFYAGSLEQASREAAAAVALSPEGASAHLLAAQVAAAGGDLPLALHETELAVTLDPTLAPAYQTLGALSLALNDVTRAEKAFRRALELQPKFGAAMTGLGQVLARQDKFREALETQQAAVSLDPGAASAHNNLGAVYMQTGRLQEAAAEFGQALALQPNWALVHGNLALDYMEMNEYARAVQEGELAVKLGARSARVHTTLARVYLKQERVNKAWAALREALALDPNYALARMHLAEVYVKLGLNSEANAERLQALVRQPSAMVDSRSYGRSEVSISGGEGARASAFTSGRGAGGQNSFYVSGAVDAGDWDRAQTGYTDKSVLALLGRQTSPDNAVVLYGSFNEDDRDLPGPALAGGLPSNADYHSNFKGGEFDVLARLPVDSATVTWRAGYTWGVLSDNNPDSLLADDNPIRRLELDRRGAMAEVRLDQQLRYGDMLTAGAAWYGQDTEVSGVLALANPSGSPEPVSYTPFSSDAKRDLMTGYVDWEKRLNERTWLLLGGRLAVANDAEPVLRPRLLLRYKPSAHSTVALLARPALADDVSRLAPVDEWAGRALLSSLGLAAGGFSQSYEAQYELQPADGSLLRVTLFQRDLRNVLVDLEDPAWSVEASPEVLAKARLRGVEAEYERWLTSRLSGGVYVRWAESENHDAGDEDVPYQPSLVVQARLDYLDDAGWRVGLVWQHTGRRYADLGNATRLESYNTLGLSVARQFDLHTDAFVTVENLLDEEYQFYRGYPERGRQVTVGLRHRF
ncbi:TonB-dependent receptor [bacterium]|nr:TonB-dependent receptor [bacterium]